MVDERKVEERNEEREGEREKRWMRREKKELCENFTNW